jgi:dihydrodipicolinate synthase/N-acetylneuraminate lyase
MFCAPSPGPVKAALASRGTMQATVRLPLVPLDERDRKRVVDALAAYEARGTGT